MSQLSLKRLVGSGCAPPRWLEWSGDGRHGFIPRPRTALLSTALSSMPRRSGRRSRRQRRRGNQQGFYLVAPSTGTVAEGHTLDLSYNTFFSNNKLMAGTPWRVVSMQFQVSATHVNSSDSQVLEPNVLQVGLNSGLSSNVENMVNRRYLVSTLPRTFTLRMPTPNLWKEDEQRDQSIASLSNIALGGAIKGGQLWVLVHAKFQFRNIPFTLNTVGYPRSTLQGHNSLSLEDLTM